MKCDAEDCSVDASMHFTRVEGQGRASRKALCEMHGERLLGEYWASASRFQMPQGPLRVALQAIVYDSRSAISEVYLTGHDGEGLLRICSGYCEGNILERLARLEKFQRPSTHHAFANTISSLGGELSRVVIHDLDETSNVYYAAIVLRPIQAGDEIMVDLRPSDAITLAQISEVPIMVYPTVLEKVERLRGRTRPGGQIL